MGRYTWGSPENLIWQRYELARDHMKPCPLRAARILRYMRDACHVELLFIAAVIKRMPRLQPR